MKQRFYMQHRRFMYISAPRTATTTTRILMTRVVRRPNGWMGEWINDVESAAEQTSDKIN